MLGTEVGTEVEIDLMLGFRATAINSLNRNKVLNAKTVLKNLKYR